MPSLERQRTACGTGYGKGYGKANKGGGGGSMSRVHLGLSQPAHLPLRPCGTSMVTGTLKVIVNLARQTEVECGLISRSVEALGPSPQGQSVKKTENPKRI